MNSCVESITSDKEIWLKFLIGSELGLDEPENPTLGAILTFGAFILGAFIPLSPYFLDLGFVSLIISSILSFVMLFLVGIFKTRITGEKPLKGALEMVLIGVVAFIVSYGIGSMMDQLVAGA